MELLVNLCVRILNMEIRFLELVSLFALITPSHILSTNSAMMCAQVNILEIKIWQTQKSVNLKKIVRLLKFVIQIQPNVSATMECVQRERLCRKQPEYACRPVAVTPLDI